MTAPNMTASTASLERSLQNCSLSSHHHNQRQSSSSSSNSSTDAGGGGGEILDLPNSSSSNATLELNSQISLPYHWEQCLDLKTGEIYYINWRTGMKAKEDPRTTAESGGDYYSEDEDEDDENSYDSEQSSSESSPLSSLTREQYHNHNHHQNQNQHQRSGDQKDHVLVVAGCKSCLMYFMVPKQVGDCPKCTGQLLHFNR